MNDRSAARVAVDASTDSTGDDLAQLLASPVDAAVATDRTRIAGVVVGTLVGFADGGATPLVAYRNQPGTAALPARATISLHGAHIGRQAVMMFEEGDSYRPIIVGCLQNENTRALALAAGHVEVDADGER